ncbi:protein stand still-like, partial [Aphis craccivora]
MDRFVTKKIRLDLTTVATEENVDDPHLTIDKSNQAHLEAPSFKYLFNDFYKVLTVEGKKLSVICQNCQQVVNGSTNSKGNFLSHIK